jgi:ATP-dependent RNA helicase HelY
MLTNADEFAAWIREVTQRPCVAFVDKWKPSRQARGIVVYRRSDLLQIFRAARASAREKGKGRGKPDTSVIPFGLFGLHQNWNPGVVADTRLIKLSDEPMKLSLSAQGRPTPNANDVAAKLAVQAVESGLKTIVFAQNAGHASTTASKIAERLPHVVALSEVEQQMWAGVVAELGGEEYLLVKPRDAALPHNGDMITLERRLVESLFRKDDGATAVVATPTLAQGMNLPAQLAILAGDKRHDVGGRASLEAHEILNAAGRAGRAGHLANGVVIMIPEPVAAFADDGRPEDDTFAKLATLLPPNDQCLVLEDPVSDILDRIQIGDVADVDISYFLSRIRPVEDTPEAREEALGQVRRSFAGFLARRANAEAAFEQKIEALRAVFSAERPLHAEIAVIAAASGLSDLPLVAIERNLEANINALPGSVSAWSDWLFEFFKVDRNSYDQLLGDDVETVLAVARGKKTGGEITNAEFDRLKHGMRAWLTGRSFSEMERALGVEPNKIKHCLRARDLALKLASRSFYIIIAAVAETAKVVLTRHGLAPVQPSLFEILPVAFRKGFDTADKVAFAQVRSQIRSRVLLHQAFAQEIGAPLDLGERGYLDVVDLINMRLAYGSA